MTAIDKTAVRNAATVIVLRDRFSAPSILMGQRGAKAAFMPNKFVFPGGAVDAADAEVPLLDDVAQPCFTRLEDHAPSGMQRALGAAAVRELWEETGQVLGHAAAGWAAPNPDWAAMADAGFQPDARALHFFFRAITPPGRPRRFDARFFLVDAAHLATDPDDFSAASGELSHLQWIAVRDVRNLDMPFITEVVLAEVQALTSVAPPKSVPFFRNDDERSEFLRLHGSGAGEGASS